MDQKQLQRFNALFGDRLGYSPVEYGKQPLYRWAWAPDLKYPVCTKTEDVTTPAGIILLDQPSRFEWEPQVPDENRWVIAHWRKPPSPDEWVRVHGKNTMYPKRGLYYITSEWLREGAVPTEYATYFFIKKIENHLGKTDAEFLTELSEAAAKRKRDGEQRKKDILDDVLPTYGSIPGKRGGEVSFGGI